MFYLHCKYLLSILRYNLTLTRATYIKQLAQQIIKDRVVIDNKGDETLYSEIVKEFCKEDLERARIY